MITFYIIIGAVVLAIVITVLAFIGLKSQREERAFKEKFGIKEDLVIKKAGNGDITKAGAPKRDFKKYSRKHYAKVPATHRKRQKK